MIDLGDYTKSIRETLRKGAYAAVYIATTETGIPATEMSRVGYAVDLPPAIKRMQALFPAPIRLEAALWVPDRGIATNISKAVGCDMMPCRRDGGWFAAPGATMQRAVELVAFRIHPNMTMHWHDDLLKRLRGMT